MLNQISRGRGGGYSAGPGGQCVCPACGTTVAHQVGVQCYVVSCPSCGSIMTRALPHTLGGTGLSAAPMPPPPLLPTENGYEKPLIPNGENRNNGNGENGKMPTWVWAAIAFGAMFLLMRRK